MLIRLNPGKILLHKRIHITLVHDNTSYILTARLRAEPCSQQTQIVEIRLPLDRLLPLLLYHIFPRRLHPGLQIPFK